MNRLLTTTLTLLLASGSYVMAADAPKHDHEEHGHGKAVALGKVTIGTTTVAVEIAGVITPGKEAHADLHLTPPTPAPKAIRVWIGIENGRGSEKAKAEGEADHPGGYEAHVDVPAPLPEGSKFWISIESSAGEVVKGSLALPAAGAKGEAHDHKDHEHKEEKK